MLKQPIAVLCSDLHLSLQQPACRADKDWMETQAGYLKQLKILAAELFGGKDEKDESSPVICAGDIFDKWNAQPELINFALEHLPDRMICVPGQHDLPNHRMDEMHRSGYGVLAKTGKIIDLATYKWPYLKTSNLVVFGFGWGREVVSCKRRHLIDSPQIAVIHKYVWLNDETRYKDAPEDSSFAALKSILKTYDAVVIGDNHKGWQTNYPGTSVLNCGGFIRRKSDEMDYRPSVGILFDDGSIVRKYLDTSKDRFHENAKEREESAFDLKGFIDGLEKLGEHRLDFREAVKNCLRSDDIDDKTKEVIMRALDDNKA